MEEEDKKSFWSYEKHKNWIRRSRTMLIVIILFLCILIAALYYKISQTTQHEGYTILQSITSERSGDVEFEEYQNGVIRYTRNGALALSSTGDLLWNGSYEMKDPIAAVCDKYVAIADRGGYNIQIFNEKGFVGELTMIYPIRKVCVAAQGVVAVMMEKDTEHLIALYESDGDLIAERPTDINETGYPIDMDLSYDGKKLVTSYLTVNTGTLQSYIAFFNFGSVGQNKTDRLTGGYKCEGEFVPKVVFLDNDTVCIFHKSGYDLYYYKELPDEIDSVKFERNIKSVIYNDKYFGMVLEEEGEDAQRLLLYDLNGKKKLEQNLKMTYTDIALTGEEIIIKATSSLRIVRANGTIKYNGTLDNPYRKIYRTNSTDQYFFVGDDAFYLIRLTKDKQKTQEVEP